MSDGNRAVLVARGVRRSYDDVRALNGVDLDVFAGEIVALLGPNGAGKTTFVSIVAGLRRADAGSVHVAGRDVLADPHAASSFIGLAAQDVAVYPMLTVRQNLRFVGKIAGVPRRKLSARMDELAVGFDLVDLIDRDARQLSGGERRRLHTAMACVHQPALLLLDEPTAGVDVSTRARVLATVKRMASDQGTAICYSTHYLHEVEELGARVLIIDRGEIIAEGSVSELTALRTATVEVRFDGQAPDVAEFAGFAAKAAGDRLDLSSADAPGVLAGLRSEDSTETKRIIAVQEVRPTLESVFLTLTREQQSATSRRAPQPVSADDR